MACPFSFFFLMTVITTWICIHLLLIKHINLQNLLKIMRCPYSWNWPRWCFIVDNSMVHSAKYRFGLYIYMYLEKHWPSHNVCFSFLKDSLFFMLTSVTTLSNLVCKKGRKFFCGDATKVNLKEAASQLLWITPINFR